MRGLLAIPDPKGVRELRTHLSLLVAFYFFEHRLNAWAHVEISLAEVSSSK
jgi:hypothetical protein